MAAVTVQCGFEAQENSLSLFPLFKQIDGDKSDSWKTLSLIIY